MPSQAKRVLSFAIGVGLIAGGWRVPVLLTIFHILLCFLLILVVLLQSGKAADLAGAFGGAGSQTAFGPRGAATFLSKATTWCAVMFMLTSFAIVVRQNRQDTSTDNSIFKGMPTKQQPAPSQSAPATPTPQPAPPPAQPPAKH